MGCKRKGKYEVVFKNGRRWRYCRKHIRQKGIRRAEKMGVIRIMKLEEGRGMCRKGIEVISVAKRRQERGKI